MTQLLPPKKEVALALLERSNVDVYLDPRAKGVVVPPQFRKEPRLILKIGLNMPVPIPDLRLDEESMSCTLSFNRSPFYCIVPWSSVFAMVGEDGRGMVWPDDVPQELSVKVGEPGQGPRAEREGLRAVESPSPASPAAATASTSSTSGTSGRRNARASKLAEDVPDRPSKATGGAGKRKKKKEEERPRPVLVAVPSEPSGRSDREPASKRPQAGSAPSQPSLGSQASQAGAHSETDDVASPSRSPDRGPPRAPMAPSPRRPPPSDGPARPKRELPPYLRVVK